MKGWASFRQRRNGEWEWMGGSSDYRKGARIIKIMAYKKADSLATFFKESSIK